MPQGKGTYGSKVGRPKKKYNIGGNVDPFSTRNPTGVPAEQMADAMENQNIANQGIPTANAQERSQASPMGSEVGTGMYKEGGFIKGVVEKYKSKKAGKKREKARKKAVEDFPITHVIQPKKKGLKPAKVPSNPPLFEGDTVKEKILNKSFLYQTGKKAGAKKGKKK